MKPRRTRQLAAVLGALGALDHPTAAELHAAVRAGLPQVSLGTIYRNLEKLVATGRLLPVHLDGEPTRYDGRASPHSHFLCESCGRITDLAGGIDPAVDTRGLRRAGYAIRAHSLGVFGVCRECRRAAVAARRAGGRGRELSAPGRDSKTTDAVRMVPRAREGRASWQ